MKKIIYRTTLTFFFGLLVLNLINSQFTIQLNCQSESESFVGLDRKDWTSDITAISESYQLNFEIPEVPVLTCSFLDHIEVSINGFNFTNNITPGCFVGYWTHALNCTDNSPISCGDILFDQSGLQSFFTIPDANELSGQNIGVDIVVVVDLNNPACMQESISVGDFDASFEICLELFYEPDQIEEEIDLGEDIQICEGEMTALMGPEDFLYYEWQGPVDSDEQNIPVALPGVYTLEVTDDNGCQSFDDIEIIEIPFPEILFNQNNPYATCEANIEDVIVNLEGVMNLSDFDFDWLDSDGNDIAGNQIFSPPGPGSYTLLVENSDLECIVETSFEIIIISPSSAAIQIDSSGCLSDSVILSAQIPIADTLGYAYEWIYGTDTTFNSSLSAIVNGEYVLNLMDSLNCLMTSDTILVELNNLNTAGEDASINLCIDEMLDLHTLLSSDAYLPGEWTQTDNNQVIPDGLFSGSSQLGVLSFWYVVTNELPCPPDTALITVNILDSAVNAGDDSETELCNEDSIDVMSLVNGDTGGYIIDSSDQILQSNVLGSADLMIGNNVFYYIIDGSNCGSDTSSLIINLLQPIGITQIVGPLCEDDSIMIGSSTYNMSSPQGQDALISSSGCDSLIIVDLQFFAPALNRIEETLCQDSIIIIEGTEYSMSNPSGYIVLENASSNLCDSIIEVELSFINSVDTLIQLDLCDNENIVINNQIYDSNNPSDLIVLANASSQGCDSTITIDLNFSESIEEDIIMTLCEEETLVVNGTLYDFSNQSGIENLLSINGCDSIINVDLNFNLNSEEELSIQLCDNESVQIGSDLYDQYNLSGTTILNGENQHGCDSIIMVNITHSFSEIIQESAEACIGDSLFLNGTWVFTNGIYEESFFNQNGCDSIVSTTVSFIDCTVTVDLDIQDLVCFNDGSGQITFEIINHNNFPLEIILFDDSNLSVEMFFVSDSGPHTINNLQAGTYNLVGENGSTPVFDLIIILNDANPINFTSDVMNPNCFDSNDGSISINSQGGNGILNIDWESGQTGFNLTDLSPGDYGFTVTDASGCTISDSEVIIAPDEFVFSLDVVDANCSAVANGQVDILNISGNSSGLTYSVDGQLFQQNSLFTNLAEGDYSYFIQDENNCLYESEFNVSSTDMNSIQAVDFISMTLGDSVTFDASINFLADQISWIPSEGLSCTACLNPIISPNTNSTYTLLVTDESGCQEQHTLTVEVNIPDITHVYYPNIFNPNNLENDRFMPLVNSALNIEPLVFRVYDRWGNLMHEENGDMQGWRGFKGNVQLESGVYLYTFEYRLNGEIFQIIGDILLLN